MSACISLMTRSIRSSFIYQCKLFEQSMLTAPIATRRTKTRWVKLKSKFSPAVPSFDYSGDNTLNLTEFSEKDNIFSAIGIDCSEISEAERDVYGIENADQKQRMQLAMKKMVEKFGRHENDWSSIEVKVALLTMRIRNQIRHVQQFPKDKITKSMLVENIQHRRTRLGELQQYDIRRFQWVCDELNITYSPPPMYSKHIPRKSQLRSDAIKEMIDMKESKLAELKDQLAQERKQYYTQKNEVMAAITAEQQKLDDEAQYLKDTRVKTGYPGNCGEIAYKLAHIKIVNREKWWRAHPEVLKLKYGSKARIPKTT